MVFWAIQSGAFGGDACVFENYICCFPIKYRVWTGWCDNPNSLSKRKSALFLLRKLQHSSFREILRSLVKMKTWVI